VKSDVFVTQIRVGKEHSNKEKMNTRIPFSTTYLAVAIDSR